jgi:hypothetical protein
MQQIMRARARRGSSSPHHRPQPRGLRQTNYHKPGEPASEQLDLIRVILTKQTRLELSFHRQELPVISTTCRSAR